ncbi:MAG: autotransporter-associated beta strand repeat-containing protein, partial [Planctomycetes bacterium]|nr:autotransporter-associated beta strand repeat-containing protein [Planctomycetota bacterium]
NLIDWTGAPTGSWNVGGLSYNGGLFRTGAETGTDLDLFQLGGGFLYDVSQFNSTGNIIVVQAETRDYYWNGDQSTNWNTNNTGNTNWLNAPAGTDPGSLPFLMDNVFFTANSATNQTTTLGQDFSINSLTFTGTGTSNTTGSSIAGNTLTLNASAGQGITVQTGSGANTISSNVVLAAAQIWTTNETTNVTTFSGVVSGGATASLTKAGPGTIVLGGGSANTYGGTTTVSAGILSVAKNDALGSTLGGTVVQADGSLELQGGITVPIGETLALNGDGATVGADSSGGALRNLSGSNSYGGSITLNSASNIQSDAGLLTIEGSISATNVNLTVEGAGNTTINGLIGTGSGTLTKNDAGTLILGNTGNSYTGSTVVNGGILQIASESNLGANPGSPSAGQLTLNGGTLATTATFTIDDANRGITIGASGGTIQTAASTVLTLSNAVVTTGTLTKTGTGALTINGTVSGANSLQVSAGVLNGGVSSAAASVIANVTVTSAGTFSAGATGNTNGDAGNGVGRMDVTGSMVWDANSTLVFDFAKSYTDGSSIPAGVDWDLLTVSGVLTKNGVGNVTLQIDSWLNDRSNYGKNEGTGSADGDDFVPSNLAGMDDPGRYRWLWVQTGGLAGFSTTNIAPGLDVVNDIVIDVSGSNVFSAYSPIPGTGGFWVSAQGNDLYINYSAVPEPGSLLLVGLAGLGFAGYRRRKRKLAEAADAAVIAASEPGENPVL